MIERNPGVVLVWTTKSYKTFYAGGPLFRLGEPAATQWFAEGRAATREEVLTALRSGIPILEEVARQDGNIEELMKALDGVMALLPLE